MFLSVWTTHYEDLRREAEAEQRLVALGVRPRRQRHQLRDRLARLVATQRHAGAAVPLTCAHAAAMAEGWVPGLRTSIVRVSGGAR